VVTRHRPRRAYRSRGTYIATVLAVWRPVSVAAAAHARSASSIAMRRGSVSSAAAATAVVQRYGAHNKAGRCARHCHAT
jgi:uncharacterized membrane protein